MNHLAEDYAISKGYCDFGHIGAEIRPLVKVDSGMYDVWCMCVCVDSYLAVCVDLCTRVSMCVCVYLCVFDVNI